MKLTVKEGMQSEIFVPITPEPVWTMLDKPLKQCKVAFITAGGIHQKTQVPYDTSGDYSYRVIPSDIETSKLMVTHGGFDNSDINKDVNAMFPLDRLRELVKEGFIGLPYMNPDLRTAERLAEVGAAAVMPLAAPIGSNRGLRTKELLQILIDEVEVPIVVDAGIGRPSEAAEAMEMGAAAVLVNTAVATAADPVQMAAAFRLAVQAGRQAYLAGPGRVLQGTASASSPLTGFLREEVI